jgi:hypothetical protein
VPASRGSWTAFEDSSGLYLRSSSSLLHNLQAAMVIENTTALSSMSSLLLDIDASIIAVELLPYLDAKDLSQLTACCCRVLRELGPDEFEKRDAKHESGKSSAATVRERVVRFYKADMYAARMELHDYSNDQATWCCRGCDTFPYLNVAALREERNQYEFFVRFALPEGLQWQGFLRRQPHQRRRTMPGKVVLSLLEMHDRAFLDAIFQRRHETSMDEALASLLDNQGNVFKQQDQCAKPGTMVVAVNLSESMDTSLVISTCGFNIRYTRDGPPRFITEHMPKRNVSHVFSGEMVDAVFYLEHGDSGAFEEAFLTIGRSHGHF